MHGQEEDLVAAGPPPWFEAIKVSTSWQITLYGSCGMLLMFGVWGQRHMMQPQDDIHLPASEVLATHLPLLGDRLVIYSIVRCKTLPFEGAL